MSEDVPADSLPDACPNCSGTDVFFHRTVRPNRLLAIFLGTGKQEIGRLVVPTLRPPLHEHVSETRIQWDRLP